MQNTTIYQKNKVFAPILLWVSLLVVIFCLYPVYRTYTDHIITMNQLSKVESEKQAQVATIEKIQALLAGSGSDTTLWDKIKRYNHEFDASIIFENVMINQFTTGTKLNPPLIQVWWVSTSRGSKLPSWLSLWSVRAAIRWNSIDDIVKYITYLTMEAPIAFTLDSISLPLDTLPWSTVDQSAISLNITLWVYYYE